MLPELPRPGIKYAVAEANEVAGCYAHHRQTQLHGFHRRFDGVLRIGYLSINVNLRHCPLQLFIREWIPDHTVIVVNHVRISMNSGLHRNGPAALARAGWPPSD